MSFFDSSNYGPVHIFDLGEIDECDFSLYEDLIVCIPFRNKDNTRKG